MSDFIPEDLMPEILKWLPVKSLVRFRCVRRSWNHLITSASFISDHLACSSMKPRLLLGYHNVPPTRLDFVGKRYFLSDPEMLEENAKTLLPSFMLMPCGKLPWNHHIVGSVNGVICLSNWWIFPGIVLWNPLIPKYIPLPRDKLSQSEDDFKLSLKIWSDRELVGFGVKESEDDFRVIRVSYTTLFDRSVGDFFMVEVCSARDRIWRALNADILDNCHMPESNQLPQCLVNGVVHWIVGVDDHTDDGGSTTNTLLVFDFEKEALGFLALPEILANTHHSKLQVRRFRGMLGALKYNRNCFGIWAMSEYGNVSSWSFIINVSTNCVPRRLKDRVLGLTEGGQILISEAVNCYPYGSSLLFLYNPANGSRRQLNFEENIARIHAPDFVESLIFMDNESGAVSPPAVQFSEVLPRFFSMQSSGRPRG